MFCLRESMAVRTTRSGVSELYSSILMVGVTLAFGSVVTSAAIAQFNGSTGGGALEVKAQEATAGKQVSLVYGTVVAGSGGCTAAYRGPDGRAYTEGRTYVLVLYDFGSVPFTPYEVFDNSTLLSVGGYATIAAQTGGQASTPVADTLALDACAHPAGQSFLLIDAAGDEVAVGT
jgi:hypothetical protein